MATIEIDGKTFEVENGKMIIEVADEAGIHIPRFCYHKKLSVAANCRMCLVEIHNSKKTVPACATPINDGMKVYTKSAAALKSQQAVMEFLLVNHPLDCPICDQGGECELQDVSMGFGADHSDYLESKRAVDDKSLGSLISTEMTRCIHCTRCVRFGEEVAGLREMGAPYRGEDVKIGTYVESSIRSEVSGNIIDLCPVGALTSKPFRYTARSWELTQKASIAPHDCLGSHIYLHARRGKIMRVIPKEHEAINETWLSDRDRFSYTGLYSEHRLAQPMIKQNGEWKVVDWSSALNHSVAKLGEILAHEGPNAVAAFASPSATLEEFYILQKWLRQLKVENLDFRLHQNDFSTDQDGLQGIQNTMSYADLGQASAVILFATQVQREVPLAATRIRQAALNGASMASIQYSDFNFPFDLHANIECKPQQFVEQLLALAAALKLKAKDLPADFQTLFAVAKHDKVHQKIAQMINTENPVMVTGELLEAHPQYAELRALIALITQHSNLRWLHLTRGANTNGGWRSQFTPGPQGLNCQQALTKEMKAYILHGVEPSYDFSDPAMARQALNKADFVLAISSFKTPDLLKHADVLLPMANLGETSGSFINVDDKLQSFEGAVAPFEQSRPAWKIYRVLANLSHCLGFEYTSSAEILAEVQQKELKAANIDKLDKYLPTALVSADEDLIKINSPALYANDMLVRAAQPLQASAAADQEVVIIHPRTAEKLALAQEVTVTQGNNEIRLPLVKDEAVAEDLVIIPATGLGWSTLGANFAKVSLK